MSYKKMMDKNEYKDSTEAKKICGVCGDKAISYNFNAITCESCKAFFRRNAFKNKQFNCPFDGNCSIDSITRRFCQKCRIKKCFDIGMKKEWILSEEEKQIKRIKIEKNRQKKQKINDNESVADSTTCLSSNQQNYNSLQIINQNLSNTNSLDLFNENDYAKHFYLNSFKKIDTNEIQSNCLLDIDLEMNNKYNMSSINITKNLINSKSTDYTLINKIGDLGKVSVKSDLLNTFSNTEKYDNIVITQDISDINNKIAQQLDSNKVIETKIEKNEKDLEPIEIPKIVLEKCVEVEFANIPIRISNNEPKSVNIIGLTDLENKKLSELSNSTLAIDASQYPMASITSETTSLVDVLKMTDRAVIKFIEMAKKIDSFKSLYKEDQIMLLKFGCPELLILRSVSSFNFENEHWTITLVVCMTSLTFNNEQICRDKDNATMIKLDVLKQANVNIYEARKKFLLSFKQEWNGDEHILNLCTAIRIFLPNRPNLIHKEVIKLEQLTYMYLLQRYLEVKYSSKSEAKNRFLKIITILEDLHKMNSDQVRLYVNSDPHQVGALMLEIFDLKQ